MNSARGWLLAETLGWYEATKGFLKANFPT